MYLPLLAVLALTSSSECAKHFLQEPSISLLAPNQKVTRTQGSTEHDTTRCGLQDKAGILWFGTTGEGVYRYENKSFTQYTIQDGLSSNTIWSIMEDKKGRIWFGTDSGLSRWDGSSIRPVSISAVSQFFKTTQQGADQNQSPSAQPAVWSLWEDKNGTIWVGTSIGMFCHKDDVLAPFPDFSTVANADGLHLKMIEDILEDRQGNMWFASGMPPGMEGLCRFDGTLLTSFKPGGQKWIRTIIEDRDGILWLGTRNSGVWRYDGTTFSRYTEQPGLGLPRLVDRSGNIWFGGEGKANGLEAETGIWRYDGKAFRNFSTKEGMGNLEVWCIIDDRDGNIWVGTRNTGLYRYDGKSFVSLSE